MLGDVIGRPGRKALAHALPILLRERHVDLCVVNGENAAAGAGLTPSTFAHLKGYGAHVVTTGNHLLDKDAILSVLGKDPTLLRPANCPPNVPGSGSCVVQTASGISVGVAHAMGRVFMHGPMDCPFRALSAEVGKLKAKTSVIVVDFHA